MSRTIDADALLDGYKNMGYDPTEHPEESYMEGWCKGFNAAVDHCMYHVIHAPTIEPERKTGRWIYDGDCYKCNKCGAAYNWWADSQTSNYCPNCGADMKEEGDE